MLTRVTKVLVSMVLVMLLVGCGLLPSPERTAEKYFSGIKTGDHNKVIECLPPAEQEQYKASMSLSDTLVGMMGGFLGGALDTDLSLGVDSDALLGGLFGLTFSEAYANYEFKVAGSTKTDDSHAVVDADVYVDGVKSDVASVACVLIDGEWYVDLAATAQLPSKSASEKTSQVEASPERTADTQSEEPADSPTDTTPGEKSGQTTEEKVPVYGLKSAETSEGYYTVKKSEYDKLNAGSKWEGEGIVFYTPATSDHPVYRAYRASTGTNYYTRYKDEYDELVANKDWDGRGIAFYTLAKDAGVEVYQLRKDSGAIYYTTSAKERDRLDSYQAWTYEKVAFWVSATA